MKETGESGSTNRYITSDHSFDPVMVCRRDSGFLPLDESESVSGAGTESAVCGYGYRCRIQDGGDFGSS